MPFLCWQSPGIAYCRTNNDTNEFLAYNLV